MLSQYLSVVQVFDHQIWRDIVDYIFIPMIVAVQLVPRIFGNKDVAEKPKHLIWHAVDTNVKH